MGIIYKFLIFFIPLIVIYLIKIDYGTIVNLDVILSGSIGLGASSLGFFIAGVTIMQTSSLSRYYERLVQLGTNKKIIGWLMASIGYLFLLSFLSVFSLFFLDNPIKLLFDIWLSTLIAAFLSGLYVTLIVMYVFTK